MEKASILDQVAVEIFRSNKRIGNKGMPLAKKVASWFLNQGMAFYSEFEALDVADAMSKYGDMICFESNAGWKIECECSSDSYWKMKEFVAKLKRESQAQ